MFPVRCILTASLVLILGSTPGWAEDKCVSFQGLITQRLGSAQVAVPGVPDPVSIYTWIGPAYVTLGADETLISPKDFVDPGGPPPASTKIGSWTIETGSRRKFDFGRGDTITFEGAGYFPTPPGKVVYSDFTAILTVLEGTGRFKGVNGILMESGPFMVWFEKPDAPPEGRYTGKLIGTLCF